MEAKLRMMDFVSDPGHTLVVSCVSAVMAPWDGAPDFRKQSLITLQMQAGPPALFDVCEYLPLCLSHFGAQPAYMTTPPLLAVMAVSHQLETPHHSTNMGADDTQFFQNLVISVSQMQCRRDRSQPNYARMIGGWNSWEITRENDRLWRHWWDKAPSASTSGGSAASNDSGFSEMSIVGMAAQKPFKQALDIGQTINRGTLDLSVSGGGRDVHEYRWETIYLDVFRVIIAKEDREIRSGLRAVVGRTMVVI